KYEAFRLIQDVKQVSLRQEPAGPMPVAPVQRKRLPIRWHDECTQFRTLLRRSFLSKLRNRANLIITIGVSPVLALLIATILRYSENGTYDFASAYHIPTFLFLGLLYSLSHWLSEHPSTDKTVKTESKLQVPLVCQFIAMRWSYEEVIVAQAKLNPLTRRQDRANDEIQKLAPKVNTPEQRARLNDLKDVLALLSGLEGRS